MRAPNDELTTDTYDANGNTTASIGKGYVYDFENHLIQAGGVTYVYDGDGNRVQKITAGATTQYTVDSRNPTGYAQVLAEWNPQTATTTYVYGLEQISRQRNVQVQGVWGTEIIYYVHDGHGSVRALTDATGTVTDTYDYDAFGNLLRSTGTTPNNYLFAGEQFDPDLGLYYNRARYLNTSTGRFWTMDAYEGVANDPASLHKYLYASADPVDFTDPSGRQIDELIALAVQYPLVTMTLVGAGIGGAGGCIAGALDSRSTCSQGFYSGLLSGAVLGAIGGAGGPAVRVVLGVAFSGWGGVSAYYAAKRHDYGLAAFYVVASLGSAFLTARLAYSTWGPSATLPPPASTQPSPPGWNSNWTQMYGTRGGFNWFDENGGEWHWHAPDPYHDVGHWDYNPWYTPSSEWVNVPAGGPAPPTPTPPPTWKP